MNQTEAADAVDVTRQTIQRYKQAFARMTDHERLLLIATLTQEKLLDDTARPTGD